VLHRRARRGYCNGYRTGRVKSAEGAIEYSAPIRRAFARSQGPELTN
jgi:hypothetical protein